MAETSILILPGLAGTDLLLAPFLKFIPEESRPAVGELPDDPQLGYPELAAHFSSRISGHSSVHIIAESFSGPIGVLLAHLHQDVVKRLTLVASFVTSPVPRIGSYLPWSIILGMPMPTWVAARYFVGDDRTLIPTLQNAVKQHQPATLRNRFGLVQTVDVSRHYAELNCRLEYIRPDHDRLVPQQCVDKILEINSATKCHRIDGPHLILQTQPGNSWQAIAE